MSRAGLREVRTERVVHVGREPRGHRASRSSDDAFSCTGTKARPSEIPLEPQELGRGRGRVPRLGRWATLSQTRRDTLGIWKRGCAARRGTGVVWDVQGLWPPPLPSLLDAWGLPEDLGPPACSRPWLPASQYVSQAAQTTGCGESWCGCPPHSQFWVSGPALPPGEQRGRLRTATQAHLPRTQARDHNHTRLGPN